MSTNYSAEKRENVNVNLDKDKNLNTHMDQNLNTNMDQNLNMNRAINQNQLEKDLPRENKDLLQHQDRMSDLNRDKDFNREKDFNTTTNKNWDWQKEENKNWKKDESHGVVGNVVEAAKHAGHKVKDAASDAAFKVKEAFSGDKNKDSDKIHGSDVRAEKHELGKEPLITDRTTNKERFGGDTTNLNDYHYDQNKNLDRSDKISTGDKMKVAAHDTKEKIKDSAKGAVESIKETAHDAKESLRGHNNRETNFEGKDFSKDTNIGGSNLAGDKLKDADWEMQHKKVIYKEEPASDARYHSTARGQNY